MGLFRILKNPEKCGTKIQVNSSGQNNDLQSINVLIVRIYGNVSNTVAFYKYTSHT